MIVASHMATLPNLLQLMAPIFRFPAVFPVFADRLVQIPLCPLHITAAVILWTLLRDKKEKQMEYGYEQPSHAAVRKIL